MKQINQMLYVTKVYPLPSVIGVYKLSTEKLSGFKCGFDGCFEHPLFVINYGTSVGAVYACRYHAMTKID
jgi:hypothetical protein